MKINQAAVLYSLPFSLLLGFSTILSIWIYPAFGYYELLRFILGGMLVISGGLFLWQQASFSFKKTGLMLAFLWGLLLLPASFLYSNNATWLEPFQYAAFVLTFIGFGHFLAQKNHLLSATHALVGALILIAFVYSVYSLLTYVFILLDGKKNIDEHLPWGFINIRYWSQVASWVVPLFPLAIISHPFKRYKSWRIATYFNLGVCVWILLLSTARGSGLALILSSVFIALIFKEQSKAWLTVFIKGVLLGVALWLLFSILIPNFILDEVQLRNFSTTSSGRFTLWYEALAMSWQNFPLGMGPFSWVEHERITEAYKVAPLYGHPHFMLLFWAAEYGWLAVLPLFGLVFSAMKSVGVLKEKASVEFVAITASVMAAVIHSCFSAVFITPYSMLVGLIVLSIFWGYCQQTNPYLHVKATRLSKIALRSLAVGFVVLGVVWLNYIYQYQQQIEREMQDPNVEITGSMSPRFWSNSHINKQ